MVNDESNDTICARDADNEKPVVLTTTDGQLALSCSLVLSSKGIIHHVSTTAETIALRVAPAEAGEAEHQIQAYLNENKNWPPRPAAPHHDFSPVLQPPTILLIGSLALLYTVTGPWSADSFWFSQGAGNTDAIMHHGQWYRIITALTLHADIVHLLGNCVFGGFLFHFFCKLTGNGLGLFSMLFTAALGNTVNVVLHGSMHNFVGFSTAVFALIGMLAMLSRHNRVLTGHLTIMPIMAGAAFLAMLGSSGERTDLGAHFFGLCSGLAGGWFLTREPLSTLRKSFLFQSILFFLFLAGIIVPWKLALLSHSFPN